MLGPNGVGKSTIFHFITGLKDPSYGKVLINNVVVTDPNSTMRAGKIALNIETKEIDINPDKSGKGKVQINTKQ